MGPATPGGIPRGGRRTIFDGLCDARQVAFGLHGAASTSMWATKSSTQAQRGRLKQLEAILLGKHGWRWCGTSWMGVWEVARTDCWPVLYRSDHGDRRSLPQRAVASGRWNPNCAVGLVRPAHERLRLRDKCCLSVSGWPRSWAGHLMAVSSGKVRDASWRRITIGMEKDNAGVEQNRSFAFEDDLF